MEERFGPLRVTRSAGVATVVIDHPPSNLVDGALLRGLRELWDDLEADDGMRAAVVASADPDFFAMHGDVEQILQLPGTGGGERGARGSVPARGPNPAAALFQRLHAGRIFTVAALDGAARGGGAELAAALDVRVGTPRTVVGQPEVAMGILPGAGGTVRLPRLLGRSRALEVILTGYDLTAEEALAAGWLDRVVGSEALLDAAGRLAGRVARMPAAAIAHVKRVVDLSLPPMDEALAAESAALGELVAAGTHRGRMRRFLAAGGQTRDGEVGDFSRIVDAMLDSLDG